MNQSLITLVIAILLASTHRLPAPIVEEEKPTPAPEQSAKPKSKRAAESKAENESPEPTTTRKASASPRTRAKPSNIESVSREAKQNEATSGHRTTAPVLPSIPQRRTKRFAGTWSGTMHEENGRTYPVTVVVDPTETKAIANGPVFAHEEGPVQINGDTLMWNWMLDSWIMSLRSETTAQLVKRYFNSTHTGTIERSK